MTAKKAPARFLCGCGFPPCALHPTKPKSGILAQTPEEPVRDAPRLSTRSVTARSSTSPAGSTPETTNAPGGAS